MSIELKESERKAIEAAVQKFEESTHAEILPVVLNKSDDYPAVRWRVAVGFSVLMTAASFFLTQDLFVSPFILLSTIFIWLILGFMIASFGTVQRFFLLEDKIREEVRQRAYEVFITHRVHATENRGGILLFVSLMEHRVEIIPDIGYEGKVDGSDWSAVIDTLLERVHTQDLTTAIIMAIEDCAGIADKAFPIAGGKMNLVRDKPIVTDK